MGIGSPNSMIHLLGSGTMPSGPSQGNVGREREVRQPEQPGQRSGRCRRSGRSPRRRRSSTGMIGTLVRSAADDEPAAAEPLQLVPLAERLADPLEPLRPHADELAAAQQPLGVRVAGQRARRSCGRTRRRTASENTRFGAEHPQVTVGRVVVEQRQLGHHRVDRDGARVVGHHQRAAGVRHVLEAAGLDPEPRAGTAGAAPRAAPCRSARGRSRSRRRRSRR